MRKFVAIAVVLVAAAAGCGDDDGDGSSEASGPSSEKLCRQVERYVEGDDFSPEATARAYRRFAKSAPADIEADLEVLRDAQDGAVSTEERVIEAGDRFTAYVEQVCGITLVPADEAPPSS